MKTPRMFRSYTKVENPRRLKDMISDFIGKARHHYAIARYLVTQWYVRASFDSSNFYRRLCR